MYDQVQRRITLYDQNPRSQSGQGNEKKIDVGALAQGGDFFSSLAQLPDSLKPHKDMNGRPLGIITKSHPILDTQGFQRIQDYALQQQAAKLLHGKSRVCFCGKRKIDKNKKRGVVYNPKTERAYFDNVMRCGSIWDCKPCAKKITEVRRKELAFANELWKSGVVLQTFDYSDYPENFIGPIRPTWSMSKDILI